MSTFNNNSIFQNNINQNNNSQMSFNSMMSMPNNNNPMLNNLLMQNNNSMPNNNMLMQNNNPMLNNNLMMQNMFNVSNNGNNQRDFSMISNIITPIIIKDHNHPLIYCYQIERKNRGITWFCNKCSSQYNCDAPSFCCTYCDFDVCRTCLGKYQLDEIRVNDPCSNYEKNLLAPTKAQITLGKKYNFHNHLLTFIKRFNSYFFWRCDKCLRNFKSDDVSYYCSLCDYDICPDCFNGNVFPNIFKNINRQNQDLFDFTQFKYGLTNVYKPVIYLYTEKPMNVRVQMILNKSRFLAVYPDFNEENTWNVHVSPNGDILLNNRVYPYLFWEAETYVPQEMNEGFLIKAENAVKFLEEKLKILGLNERESTDFITYWLPVLYRNKLSLCTFQTKKYLDNYQLNITPKPTTIIRVFLSIKKLDSPIDIKEQKLESNERKGFTVIEWGGSNLSEKI